MYLNRDATTKKMKRANEERCRMKRANEERCRMKRANEERCRMKRANEDQEETDERRKMPFFE